MDNFIGAGQHCREAAEILEPIRKGFLSGDDGIHRARRILYGSDWSMLSKEYYYADYLPVVAHMYRRKIYGVGAGAEKNTRAFRALRLQRRRHRLHLTVWQPDIGHC